MSDLLELAERCEDKAIRATRYAVNPPGGYSGTHERAEAAQWFAIAAALRARAQSVKPK
ncbi:hypothetical protein [Rhizorhabdus histidinilytica]|uniref:Uncharacterized protein n=1 Tax=Rhizorhabdus histidinilytica TaxID=439228 RepID=A0A1T5A6V8_9SPHN|nr:hypothetical protein SAMN06295920_101656 [Rhizorhabdus histidinilytica]